MKKILNIILLFTILFSICVLYTSANNSSLVETDIKIYDKYYPDDYVGYQYPILPGMSNWPYGDHTKMVEVCKIPEKIYQSMTTEELAQSILYYPLIADIFAYDNNAMGLEIVTENFSALQEFSCRLDSASCLIELYTELDTVDVSTLDITAQQDFKSDTAIATTESGKDACKKILNSLVLSVMLSNDTYTSKMTLEDRQTLYEIIQSREEDSILKEEVVSEVGVFVDNSMGLAENINNTQLSTNSITYTLVRYIPWDVDMTTITTPKNEPVSVYVMKAREYLYGSDGNYYYGDTLDDFPNSYKTAINTEYYNIYGITPIVSPTVKYNCHSYAWYTQTNCNYWMNNSEVPTARIGYTNIGLEYLAAGDRVVYSNNSVAIHSAIVKSAYFGSVGETSPTIILTSKWGSCGLYDHLIGNDPYTYDGGSGTYADSHYFYTP